MQWATTDFTENLSGSSSYVYILLQKRIALIPVHDSVYYSQCTPGCLGGIFECQQLLLLPIVSVVTRVVDKCMDA